MFPTALSLQGEATPCCLSRGEEGVGGVGGRGRILQFSLKHTSNVTTKVSVGVADCTRLCPHLAVFDIKSEGCELVVSRIWLEINTDKNTLVAEGF